MPVGQALDRTIYGRDQLEWNTLTTAGLKFLIERARLGRPTSYTELNEVLRDRTRCRRFDFNRQDERAAMGHLLGLIVENNHPRTGLMISALVLYLGSNDAGSGFYGLAQDLGLLRHGADDMDKLDFWSKQVSQLFAFYASDSSKSPRPSA